MQYTAFEIENFKGVGKASLAFNPRANSNVLTIVGLNESGKTTLLEGVYSFSPDTESRNLFDKAGLLDYRDIARIPKSELYNFNGKIAIKATVRLEDGEREKLNKQISAALGLNFASDNLPDLFTIEDITEYSASKVVTRKVNWSIQIQVKGKRAANWRQANVLERRTIFRSLENRLPAIAYFPTFLSDVPERIYLRGHDNDPRNRFYRTVFQDILDALDNDITIEKHILARVDPPTTFAGTITEAIADFWGSGSRHMVQQVIDKASAKLSSIIVTRWNEMFDKQPVGKEIVIDWTIEEAADGELAEPYITFSIRDGADRYNIADRSLGFRWFFCFLLFTQFRARRKSKRGTVFLFDEPASNLHAKAQEKLLDSFRDICTFPNALIYSTHSPYMVNPLWLDQTYIIENDAVGADLDDIGEMRTSEETKITAKPYADFVEEFPDRLSHFQPVLDRLEVKPSLLSISKKTVLVEGKSDFAIMAELERDGPKLAFNFVPAHGAQTMKPLVSLLKGWGWPFAILLDSDDAGSGAKKLYEDEYNIVGRVFLLSDLVDKAKGIESLLLKADLDKVQSELGLSRKANKKQIYRFFQTRSYETSPKKLATSSSKAWKQIQSHFEKYFQ
jgi:hypothetical protein